MPTGAAAVRKEERLPPPPECAVSYLCRLPSARGRFNAAAAIALGVPKGKAFGELASGKVRVFSASAIHLSLFLLCICMSASCVVGDIAAARTLAEALIGD